MNVDKTNTLVDGIHVICVLGHHVSNLESVTVSEL